MTPTRAPVLRRSEEDRVITGVLAGIARFAGLDPFRLRLAYFAASLLSAGFPGILVYLALWYVIPSER